MTNSAMVEYNSNKKKQKQNTASMIRRINHLKLIENETERETEPISIKLAK